MKRKVRKEVKYFLAAIIVIVCGIFLIKMLNRDKPAADHQESGGSETTVIENEGDLEIIIPEDMESEGF